MQDSKAKVDPIVACEQCEYLDGHCKNEKSYYYLWGEEKLNHNWCNKGVLRDED